MCPPNDDHTLTAAAIADTHQLYGHGASGACRQRGRLQTQGASPHRWNSQEPPTNPPPRLTQPTETTKAEAAEAATVGDEAPTRPVNPPPRLAHMTETPPEEDTLGDEAPTRPVNPPPRLAQLPETPPEEDTLGDEAPARPANPPPRLAHLTETTQKKATLGVATAHDTARPVHAARPPEEKAPTSTPAATAPHSRLNLHRPA